MSRETDESNSNPGGRRDETGWVDSGQHESGRSTDGQHNPRQDGQSGWRQDSQQQDGAGGWRQDGQQQDGAGGWRQDGQQQNSQGGWRQDSQQQVGQRQDNVGSETEFTGQPSSRRASSGEQSGPHADSRHTEPPSSTAPVSRNPAPTDNPAGRESEVPVGFRVSSLVLGLFGLLLTYAGISAIQLGHTAAQYDTFGASSGLTVLGITALVLGGGHLLGAYRTWRFHPKGWKLAVTIFAAGTAVSLVGIANGGSATAGLGGIAVYGGLGWYLYTNRSLYRRLTERNQPEHGRAQSAPETTL